MFKELDEPTNLLDDAWLDQAIFNLKHKVWISDYERWRKWLRDAS